MTEDQKAAMDEAFDMIREMMDFIRDNVLSEAEATILLTPRASIEAREMLSDARGVLDLINDEIYKDM